MNNETILYFSDDDIGTGTGVGAYKASRFMGMDQVNANTVDLYFKNRDWEAGEENSVRCNFTGAFKDLATAVAGVINSKKSLVVIADSTNSVYLSFPGGAFFGDPVLTQTA